MGACGAFQVVCDRMFPSSFVSYFKLFSLFFSTFQIYFQQSS